MTLTIDKDGQLVAVVSKSKATIGPDHVTMNDYQITGPGEYDVGGIAVDVGPLGVLVHAEGIHLLVVRDPSADLTSLGEVIDMTNVVVCQLSDDVTQAKQLAKVIAELEPQGVIVAGDQTHAKVVVSGSMESVSKLTLTVSDLPEEGSRAWVIAPRQPGHGD